MSQFNQAIREQLMAAIIAVQQEPAKDSARYYQLLSEFQALATPAVVFSLIEQLSGMEAAKARSEQLLWEQLKSSSPF